MLVYYITYIVMLTMGMYTYTSHSQRYKKTFCIITAIMWILILGLRHPSMGVDLAYGAYYGYLGQFTYLGNLSWSQVIGLQGHHYELGYRLFCKAVMMIGSNYNTLLFFCALFSISIFYIFIYSFSEDVLLSSVVYLSLGCFLINYSGLRQGMAVAITIFAFKMIIARKPIQFIFATLLASQFHATAIIFLIAYPLYYYKPKRFMKYGMLCIPTIIYFLRGPVFNILGGLFKDNVVAKETGAFTLFALFYLILIALTVLGDKESGTEIGLRNLFFVAVNCQALGSVYQQASRMGFYFLVYLAVLVPEVVSNCRNRNQYSSNRNYRVIYWFALVGFFIFGLYQFRSGDTGWTRSYPYKFFWQSI